MTIVALFVLLLFHRFHQRNLFSSMIWIASFPRSGNTFLRNILYEVYGLESSTYHREASYPLDRNFDSYAFVKTHELPEVLAADGLDVAIPSVYLVRDGRDALCSIAHHRADLIEPGSDYYENLRTAIIADQGSYHGGWMGNVEAWLNKADLVIRYEDLVQDPLSTVQRIGQLADLPSPQLDKLPTFESMKFGVPQYGAGRNQDISDEEKHSRASKFFRRGKAGGWKDDLPPELHDLFWSYHGETMIRLGYGRDGELGQPHPDLEVPLRKKLGIPVAEPRERPYRVLIEGNKLLTRDNDGVKRYQVELLKELYPIAEDPDSRWHIDVHAGGEISPLSSFRAEIFEEFKEDKPKDGPGAAAEERTGDEHLPQTMDQRVRSLVPDSLVDYLVKRDIRIFHRGYDFILDTCLAVRDSVLHLLSVVFGYLGVFRGHVSQQMLEQINSYDLVHLPLMQNFPSFRRSDSRKLVTVHDLTHIHFPEFHTPANVKNSNRGLKFAMNSDARLIAISKSTQSDLIALDAEVERRTELIYEAADPRKFHFKANKNDGDRAREKYGLLSAKPYIICLSTLEPRKNLINSVKAFVSLLEEEPDLDLRLVIAGKRGWDVDNLYRISHDYPDHILFTGFVDDGDLAHLYSDALALSYLSFYEGFGLPLLEAMRCGTPVIYGDNSSMTEIAGDAGLPADPHDIVDIKRQYRSILDPDLRERMSQASLKRAMDFSCGTVAVQTLNFYQQIIEGER